MTSPELCHREMTMLECIPQDISFLATYQENAFNQILWDNQPGRTIKGSPPKVYMLSGLKEEINELLIDEDRTEPAYKRLGALLLLNDSPNLIESGAATETALHRHLKEFGDVSWYLANYLTLFGLKFDQAVNVGKEGWNLDNVSQPRSTAEFSEEIERKFPFFKLLGYATELLEVAEDISDVRRDERLKLEQKLIIASGKFVLSMMHVAASRFGVTYESILDGNRSKLEKRKIDGTIFDKQGGDDR